VALPESYINNVGSLAKFLDAIRTAGVPERVTFEFLKTLGFTSSNDRPIIGVLKGIRFLDQNGAPTESYKAFRDPHQGPKVLARALRAAYSDLFLANTKAHDLPADKLRGIIATKTSKGDVVVKLIAGTFKALAKAADFSDSADEPAKPVVEHPGRKRATDHDVVIPPPAHETAIGQTGVATLHYNIQIHLPTTTDVTVYNAIFKSLKENLF
jgi:uncharacterized protein DUF5343